MIKEIPINLENKIRFDVITSLPEMFASFIESSIIKIARTKGLVEIYFHNLHDFADNKFKHIDDTVYGGGAGMLLECGPAFACIEKLLSERTYDEVIFMTADGEQLKQRRVNRLSLAKNLIILCGHFKGIDQRIRDTLVTLEISIGDYVLTGGEPAAMVLVDAVSRLIPGVIGDAESALEDSFQEDLLEAPNYTKPAEFRGMKVPDVLLGGNHKEIEKWRREQSLLKTQARRPDLLVE